MQHKQQQENMIFFLAGLSSCNYTVLQEIYRLYETNSLGKTPKSKKDPLADKAWLQSNILLFQG